MSDDEKKPRARRGRRDRLAGERTRAEPTEELHQPDHAKRARRAERQIPPGESPAYFWPEGEPEPERFVIRARIPCRSCKRVLTEHASQAVVCDGVQSTSVAYLRCRSCGHRWSLPVEVV